MRLASPATALALGGLTAALGVLTVVLTVVAHDPWPTFDGLGIALLLGCSAVGVVIARREPGNAVGWLFILLALLVMLDFSLRLYLVLDFRLHGGRLPLGAPAVYWEGTWSIFPFILILPAILLFPDGRVPSGNWRRLLWVYAVLAAAFMASQYAAQFSLRIGHDYPIDVRGKPTEDQSSGIGTTGWFVPPVLLLCWLGFVGHQINRWRRSAGIERQQLKWLMSGAAVCVTSSVVLITAGSGSDPTARAIADASIAGIAALPVAFGVAILRYRLYEIDRLISRTVSYAIVTGILAGVFIGVVVVATDVLPFSSPIAVAASTLAAAALFSPLRRRVQGLVDRRFNRSRYDGDAIVASFSARLRDAIDPDTVHAELLLAVERTIEPAHASIWIRDSRA